MHAAASSTASSSGRSIDPWKPSSSSTVGILPSGGGGGGGSSSSMCVGVSAAAVQDASVSLFGQLAQQAVAARTASPATATQTALCTFLVQQGSSTPELVALGTGTWFFARPLAELTAPAQRGKLLLDCHGEVVARRSLLRWLYAQAATVLMLHCHLQRQQEPAAAAGLRRALDALHLELVCGPDDHTDLAAGANPYAATAAGAEPQPGAAAAGGFAPAASAAGAVSHDDSNNSGSSNSSSSGSGDSAGVFHGIRLRLKPDRKLHMFINKPPCGDACEFNRPPATAICSSSGPSACFHFSTAKPQRLPALPNNQQGRVGSSPVRAVVSSGSLPQVQPQAQGSALALLLPSEAALAAHWPQGCAVLDPERAATHRGCLCFKACRGENRHPVPTAPPAGPETMQGGLLASAGMQQQQQQQQAAPVIIISAPAAPHSRTPGAVAAPAVAFEAAVPAAAGAAGASGVAAEAQPAAAAAAGGTASMRKMCCSDKLASWNALGLQGALLGQLLEPVYLSSVTVGGPAAEFCEGAVCRAICCRLAPDLPPGCGGGSSSGCSSGCSRADRDEDGHVSKRQQLLPARVPGAAGDAAGDAAPGMQLLPPKMYAAAQRGLQLPAPYRVAHPRVLYACPSSTSSRWAPGAVRNGSSCAESLNWNAAEKNTLEVCAAAAGTALKLIDIPACAAPEAADETGPGDSSTSSTSSTASRLSKAALFSWYQQLRQSAGELAGLVAAGSSRKAAVGQGGEQRDTAMRA